MKSPSLLFEPLTLKNLTIKNRIWVSPMCQYSSIEGHPTEWHTVHLGSRAVGGAGLIMVEATAVNPEGRISPQDSGIWSNNHVQSFKPICDFAKSQNCAIGIQLAHAGRKASTTPPWLGGKYLSVDKGGWLPYAPSAIPFKENDPAPIAMTNSEIEQCIEEFKLAAKRALNAGFQVLELHMAHGYLFHEFLSPLSNHRQDKYGGILKNRMRFPLEATQAVREVWPDEYPLFVRISATDWANGPSELAAKDRTELKLQNSWNLFDSILLAQELKKIGVDLIDCSSGGNIPHAEIPVGPNYQVLFSEKIRIEAQIATAAVGMITDPQQAESILKEQQADAVFIAREFLRQPYWPQYAAQRLDEKITKPVQYARS